MICVYFPFESRTDVSLKNPEYARKFSVAIEIASNSHGEYVWQFVEIIDVDTPNDPHLRIEELSEEDRKDLTIRAEQIALDQAGNAYESYIEAVSDRTHEEDWDGPKSG